VTDYQVSWEITVQGTDLRNDVTESQLGTTIRRPWPLSTKKYYLEDTVSLPVWGAVISAAGLYQALGQANDNYDLALLTTDTEKINEAQAWVKRVASALADQLYGLSERYSLTDPDDPKASSVVCWVKELADGSNSLKLPRWEVELLVPSDITE
jgi:hypothetical protein